jgi:hypothetical protein
MTSVNMSDLVACSAGTRLKDTLVHFIGYYMITSGKKTVSIWKGEYGVEIPWNNRENSQRLRKFPLLGT